MSLYVINKEIYVDVYMYICDLTSNLICVSLSVCVCGFVHICVCLCFCVFVFVFVFVCECIWIFIIVCFCVCQYSTVYSICDMLLTSENLDVSAGLLSIGKDIVCFLNSRTTNTRKF